MSTQSDLDLAMAQLEDLPAEALELYAYAAIKLLQERNPVKQGSFDVFISESPQFSEIFQREIPTFLTAKISVSETVTGIE